VLEAGCFGASTVQVLAPEGGSCLRPPTLPTHPPRRSKMTIRDWHFSVTLLILNKLITRSKIKCAIKIPNNEFTAVRANWIFLLDACFPVLRVTSFCPTSIKSRPSEAKSSCTPGSLQSLTVSAASTVLEPEVEKPLMEPV